MHKLKILVITILSLCALLTAAGGQNTEPDIVGTWIAVDGSGVTFQGETNSIDDGQFVVTIIEQNGPTFLGSFRWSLSQSFGHLHDGTQNTNKSAELFLGTFSSDGVSFVVADYPDTGYWFGRMLDNDTMELLTVESGPFAYAGRWVYKRQ